MPESMYHCGRECVAETKLSSDVQEIIAYLDELECDIDIVGLEAGTLSQYLTYGLQAADFNVVCMEAQQVKGTTCDSLR
ncbi:MAG: hypothetical protein P8Z33_14160 [Gammaproteobacteria bacterium]